MSAVVHTPTGAPSYPMHPLPPRTRIQVANREELVNGILDVMRRTWRGREIQRMKLRLQRLDQRSLREIAYRHGAFEQDEWVNTF